MIRRASERKTGKEVAIKTVSRDQIDKAGIRREIIVLQRLNSDRLVKILKSYHTGMILFWNSNRTGGRLSNVADFIQESKLYRIKNSPVYNCCIRMACWWFTLPEAN